MKIKKGDLVKVITGREKEKEGKVLSVDKKNHKVLIEGIKIVKKHTKPNARKQTGGIVDQEAAIDISNVMYLHKGQPTRIGFAVKDGKKVRVAKATGDIID